MKELLDLVADFIKKMMQPLITLVMIFIFGRMTLAGQFKSEEVFYVVVGVLVFWFGYTAIKNFTYTPTSAPPSAKPPSAAPTIGTTANWDNDPWDTASFEEPLPKANGFDKALKAICNSLEADGIELTDEAVASHIISYLGVHEDEMTEDEVIQLLDYGIIISQRAFQEALDTDIAPETYDEVAKPQSWWLAHKKSCTVKDFAIARPLLMTLRDLLRRREAL